MDALRIIKQHRLVPVVVFERTADVVPCLTALEKGGLPVAEITFRTECAADAIKIAAGKFPDMLIGAGTVISGAQCKEAITCGARFIVSPGLSEEAAAVCKSHSVPYIPGVVTPSEIIKALSLGLSVLKFFPASDFGGLKTIKALSAAFPQVMFMPTGGVSAENIKDYLSFPKVVACGGSWMMKGTPAEIEENTKKAVSLTGGIE